MIDTIIVRPAPDTAEASGAGVSWAAVIAGAVVAFALTLVLLAFGTGLGGYLAGRLHSRWVGMHSDEVYFRDTAHGRCAAAGNSNQTTKAPATTGAFSS
jgi:hypothetical protein